MFREDPGEIAGGTGCRRRGRRGPRPGNAAHRCPREACGVCSRLRNGTAWARPRPHGHTSACARRTGKWKHSLSPCQQRPPFLALTRRRREASVQEESQPCWLPGPDPAGVAALLIPRLQVESWAAAQRGRNGAGPSPLIGGPGCRAPALGPSTAVTPAWGPCSEQPAPTAPGGRASQPAELSLRDFLLRKLCRGWAGGRRDTIQAWGLGLGEVDDGTWIQAWGRGWGRWTEGHRHRPGAGTRRGG